jgi:hypothetical protein
MQCFKQSVCWNSIKKDSLENEQPHIYLCVPTPLQAEPGSGVSPSLEICLGAVRRCR